jgi:hypothetical protein
MEHRAKNKLHKQAHLRVKLLLQCLRAELPFSAMNVSIVPLLLAVVAGHKEELC